MLPAGPRCENKVRKKGKTPHGFPSFFASHSAVGFWKLLALKITSQNRIKRALKFPVLKFAT